jgi:hypothetical protein
MMIRVDEGDQVGAEVEEGPMEVDFHCSVCVHTFERERGQ